MDAIILSSQKSSSQLRATAVETLCFLSWPTVIYWPFSADQATKRIINDASHRSEHGGTPAEDSPPGRKTQKMLAE